ncbi:sensor histidine kinase [Halomonas halocynthiae]|uniref:sensor histidine kinase n=1 Tax=Halomonas halocynthiae TaxID=176290 RepID=UPI0003FAF770|nr:HAMP domain-containing sensor histidine kinase [Halomonas halocynthiae]
MSSGASRRWRPRSLLQLLLLAFFAVMLPLAVLVYQTGQALFELSEVAEKSARQAVEETRRAHTIASLALNLERSARQYAVVEEPSLLNMFDQQLADYSALLKQHHQLLPDDPDVLALVAYQQELVGISALPIEAFSEQLSQFSDMSQHIEPMRQATNSRIDQRLDAIRTQALEVREQLWWQALGLVSVSLLLVLLFTRLIIRPVSHLEKRILSIGGSQTTPQRPIQGPAELVRLDERLDWLTSRLHELEEEKRQFLRHMSHELKTPLASVREGASLLADGVAGEMTASQRDVLALIDASGSELQRLIEQLLDYNVLQQGRSQEVSRADVAVLAREVLAKHRLALKSKGMRVTLFDGPLYWHVIPSATTAILDNLISNAVAYGEDAGVLEVRADCSSSALVIEVANSGEAIALGDREKLFTPFYQGQARRKGVLKGSGIGLSVASDCARLQRGTLALVDDDRLPVCFQLVLPPVDTRTL